MVRSPPSPPPRPRAAGSAGLAAALAFVLAGCPAKEPPCPAGQTRCGGTCVDLAADPFHCGFCTLTCATGASCTDGKCGCPASTPDLCPVNGTATCVDLTSDVQNCGACGASCGAPGTATCAGRACVCAAAPVQDCGGTSPCVDTSIDPKHCGGCDAAPCLTNGVCVNSICGCPANLPDACPPACVDTATDPAHCGGCDATPCLTNGVCVNSICGCPAKLPDVCPGDCVDEASDPSHCGDCAIACAGGQSCCGGICSDLATDPQNCGSCGNACTTGQTCSEALCCAAGQLRCSGTCCGGTACCASGCQSPRQNGLGQTFLSCDPPETWSVTSATEAATAWDSSGNSVAVTCLSSCLGWRTTSACAVWCYSGSLQGLVQKTPGEVCGCPAPELSTGTW